ncbi:hypothetical protein B1756_00765 [Natrarchaeobaculum aegyptiacum]|uniref:DUF7305 domain-containing protein n=2 Tax=Natrarchaeobaculum aegyptiacum TaxID=745377 RepID=A0A2Z2HWY1_9EURY|nr:hypothetical protein B1756_00765 [Natrarchaeobaculum aegyptiacum]
MVGTLSVGLFLVGGEAVSSLEQQSERERVESAFVELSHQMAAASDNRSGVARTIDLDVGQEGTVVREETGTINVSSNESEGVEIEDLTIGTIEWQDTDGSVLAYEAGAVFRERGNETQVVSAPAISYEHSTDTLTLPVLTATGDEHLGTGDVTLSSAKTTAYQEATVVNGSVTITIQSEYYRGWETFFRSEAGDTSVQDVDHQNETIEVLVGYLDVEESYEDGILVSENFDDFENAEVNATVAHGSMPELDPVIDEIVEDAEDDGTEITDTDTTHGPGTYWTDDDLDLHNTDELVFDTSSDNVTLVVDGDITVGGTLEATPNGSDNELKIYTTGNFHVDNGDVLVTDGNAASLQLYGSSDTHIAVGPGGSSYTGTIYAAADEWGDKENEVFGPGCTEQVCMQSNVDFTGAVIASSSNIHSAGVNFTYDDSLENNDISLYPNKYTLPPQLTYLNVAHHEIDVRN